MREGMDSAVAELAAGLELLANYIDEAHVTDPAILRLRDNLRRTIAEWQQDLQRN